MGFRDEGASSMDSSFDALLSNNDTENDNMIISMPPYSHAEEASTFPVFFSS